MASTARLNYLRIAPRKVRMVADLIRGKSVEEAERLLKAVVKRAALPFGKLLKSAVASAKQNLQLESADLYISRLMVDEGPKLKRWRPRARGRGAAIQKKTSHIILVLDRRKEQGLKTAEPPAKEIVKDAERVVKSEKKVKTASAPTKKPPRDVRGISKGGKIMQRVFRRKAF